MLGAPGIADLGLCTAGSMSCNDPYDAVARGRIVKSADHLQPSWAAAGVDRGRRAVDHGQRRPELIGAGVKDSHRSRATLADEAGPGLRKLLTKVE